MIDWIIENDLVFASAVHNFVDLGLKKNNSVKNIRKSTLNHFKKYLIHINSNHSNFYEIPKK
jgi:hypothetical protein